MKIRYGREVMTKTLDPNGSVLITTKGYKNYVERVTNRYEIRVKVHSEQEELEEYLKFQKEKLGKRHPEFKIEHSQPGEQDGYYYVVKCWTEV